MQKRRSIKQAKLLASAQSLIHQQGLHKTTLADIAEDSGVSIGNMYYYFKTKEDILRAVAGSQVEQFNDMVAAFKTLPSPRARLAAFIDERTKIAPEVAKWGCPIGSLIQEIAKYDVDLQDGHNALKARLSWAEQQFSQMEVAQPAMFAQRYVASLQGACLLASTYHDPSIFIEQGEQLKAWLDTL
ncbi:TetR/AcrR family transcriptional regulator [Ferrimonas lipolytica]|uniref:TetR/AcrR family transcriptional regulator n=1 Tax=Ferrimonas lipolytica TaxID=2724191 RepID=A0A6H1UAB3_9GAMM|nr:TetR/AcrR family transcriptional regulator [Ferrimonas lipolytica]QIZ75768.1 TetR/AcrR family transcriptional regulator [Ferrimonas lipolytica]